MSWPLVKLAEVATINPRLPKDVDEAQEVSFVAMASASEEGSLLAEESRVLSETRKGFTYFEKSDVLLAKITPCFENGKCLRPNQIRSQIGFGSTEFHVLRVDPEKLDSQYLFYMVWSDKFRWLGESSMSGAAGQKRVSADFLRGFEIPLPPLAEQKRIAAILDKADAIRRKRQQAIQLADEFLRSVFLDMFGDPVTNPKGWEVKPIGDFCRFQGGFAFKSADFTDSGVPLVKITNVHFENVDWSDISYLPEKMLTEKPDFSLRSGDLVMAMTRPIIKSLNAVKVVEIKDNDIPSLLNQRVGRFRGYEQSASKCFLKYFLYSEYFKSEVDKLCSVALQPNVSSKQIESIACYLPPKILQDDFSRIVNVVTEALPKMNVATNEKLFESLSHRAFSGIL